MASNWQETYKKLKKRKELVDTLSGGGDLAPIKSSVSNRNVYTKGTETTLQSNVAPVKTTKKSSNKSNSSKENITSLPNVIPSDNMALQLLVDRADEKKILTNFPTPTTKASNLPNVVKDKGWVNSWKTSLSDGYDFGDISKAIIGNVADIGGKYYKGITTDPVQTIKSTFIGATHGMKNTIDAIDNASDDFFDFLFKRDDSKEGLSIEELNSLNSSISTEEKEKILKEAKELYGEDSDYYKLVVARLNSSPEKNIFNMKYTDTQTYKDMVSGDLSEEQQEIYNLSASGGEQILPAAATLITGNPYVGKAMFYVQAQQNYTEQAKAEGKTDAEARTYGLVMGGFETLTEALGFDEAGGQLTKSTILKAIKGEALEEAIMPYVESGYRTTVFKEEFDLAETTNEAIEGAVYGGILGGVMSMGGKGYAKTDALIQKINSGEQVDPKSLKESLNEIEENNPGYIKGLIEQSVKGTKQTNSQFTQNEQSIVDKVVEERIAEAETNNKKLSKKEKTKIEEQVKEELQKGYISTDTIESTLGGDTYNQLQSIRDNKTSIENEIKELENKNFAELKVAEKERLDSLREELKQIDTNTLETQLQSEMAGKIAKDDYLQRSYQEKAKRGQQFTYDATKITNENEKAVYESAAKVMNDTNRSHEFVEKVAKIAKDKGTNYGFINNEELKSLGYDVKGKQVNGLVRTTQDGKQSILINVDSVKALNTIVGHETTHLLEGTQEYKDLQEAIFNYAKTKGEFDSRQSSLNELYKGIEGANVDSELTADLVGDYLFTDSEFIESLSVQKPSVFKKIKELIDDLVTRFTGTKEEKQLREVQKRFKEAYRNSKNVVSQETKYNQEVYDKVKSEKQIVHMGNVLEILKSGTFSGSVATQNIGTKPSRYKGYSEGIVFKPNAIDYLNESKLYKGDGGNNGYIGENPNKYTSIEDYINEDTSKRQITKYNEGIIEKDNALPINTNTVDYILVDKNTSQEFIDEVKAMGYEVRYSTEAKTDTKYSVSDNTGRNLSEYTLEKTKNSKVRDENGNLMLMYHGSPDGNYDQLKAGTYFTSDRKYAERYTSTSASSLGNGRKITNNPKIYETYLNIEKPFDLSDPEAKNIYINDYVKGGNALGINPYLSDVEYNKIDNIDWTEVEDLKDFLQENGYDYDGIIADEGGDFDTDGNVLLRGKSYIPFSEEQIIKANNNNTRYSLSEKGTLQDSNGNDVRLETSETGTHGTLMAIHNLSSEKLKGILELGGFPVPSIAVTNPSIVDFSNYGDISVLFDKNTIDPSDTTNEVYGSDVYSPRFPQTVNELNEVGVKQVSEILEMSPSEFEANYGDMSIDDAASRLIRNEKIIDKYLESKNITVDPIYKEYKAEQSGVSTKFVEDFLNNHEELKNNDINLRELEYDNYSEEVKQIYIDSLVEQGVPIKDAQDLYGDFGKADITKFLIDVKNFKKQIGQGEQIDTFATKQAKAQHINFFSDEYINFVENLISPAFGDKYIRNNKDVFTPSGNRRSFKQLHDPYNLENVVKTMKGKVRGEEGFFYGAGNIRSQVTPQFKSIADIKANEGKLVTTEQMEEVKQDIDSDLNNLSVTAKNFGGYSYDSYETALNEIASLKKITSTKAKEILNDYGFNNVPDILVDKSIEFLEKLKNAPTEYFEAKPQRAVGLNEVQAIVVPNNISTELKQQLLDNGLNVIEYDSNIKGDRQNKINQFDDLKFSLSQQGEQIAPTGNYNVYGEDVKLEQAIAPLQEEIQTLTETVQGLKEQLAPVQEVKEVEYTQPTKVELDNLMALQETGGTEYANTFFGLRDKYGQRNLYKGINQYKKAPDTYEAPIKGDEFAPTPQNIVEQQGQEAFNNIDESSMPSELEDIAPVEDSKMTSTESLFETRDYEDVGNRKVNAYQYDNPEVKPYFQEEAQAMLGDLKGSIKGERSYNDDLYYATNGEQGFYGTERQTTDAIAELLDGMDGKYKYTYADIEKGLNAIIKDEGSENNAISKRIEFYLDQRLREGYTTVDGIEVPANQGYINMMAVKEMNDYYNSLPITDDMMPVENVENYVDNVSNRKSIENIAPIKEQYEAITPEKEPKLIRVKDNPTYNQIAEVLVDEPKTASDRNKRKWAIFKANVFDKGIVFEDLSLKENNRELIAKWDYTLTSEARGQYAIGNGHNGLSKSLNDIRAEVENTGNTKDFYNYMYHKHNVDRMTLASRFEGMENKPVFGDSVTAEQSQAIVNQYEKTHPEFIDFAQDVYDYVNADKQLLVDNGVISQETADLWSKMYPHYVPTRRTTDTGIDINVPLDTRRTGINAPIKQATGGSSDILPLFDTMAMRTLQTYRATAKNSFGVELLNTLGTIVESNQTNVDEVIDSVDTQDGLLQEGKKGKNPTFTVFENGEKITFEITKDMYDALKPVSESSLLSKTIKPLNVAGNIRRGLLTEYNPTFMLTNAIKDTQDILINSQHVAKTYGKIPEAHKQLLTKGYWYQEYVANGGEQNSYFDNETNTFKTENKGLAKMMDLPPLSTISKINNHIEMIPRLAEYIASRESGRSIEVSMLDAARVTTNFKAGGAVTKFANRNGATFLNASVQGAMQQVRNIREAKANGVRGWVNLATKFTMAGLPAILLNGLIWDDDEEYEELSDYVKQNYYIVGKTEDGTFIRIPKGRTVAVIQDAINQMGNLVTGDDEVDLKSFIDLAINNLAPNNPLDNNILSPITQVVTNKAWYGGDLLPTRLQNLPAAEQYDESTDMFSRWIGEIFNVSPYKVNYLLDQYSGGVGDLILPMMTPEAESDGDSLFDYAIAPLRNKFTTNSTFNNQNISDFYDTKEELTVKSNKTNATDEDVLKNKYMNSVNAELNELYQQKREIQNSNLSNSEKYKQAKEIQEQINELAKNALSEYTNVSTASNYSTVGDKEYYKRINSEGEVEWTKVNDEEAADLNSLNFTSSEKNTYFKTKGKISSIIANYKDDKIDLESLDENSDEYKEAIEELSDDKKADIIDKVMNSGLNSKQKAYLYGKYYSSDKTLDKITDSGISFDDYLTFSKESLSLEDTEAKVEHLYNADMTDEAKTVIYETSVLSGFDNEKKYKDYKVSKLAGVDINSWLSYKKQEFVADKDSSGKSISGSRKEKVFDYINSLDIDFEQRVILAKLEYPSYDEYNYEIIDYLNNRDDISYEEEVIILEELGFEVDSEGNIRWD